ncbi:MAG: hypothetical protein K9N46_12815 [Candidatus Marinimicrobia bacterium]|nr:hypothetical protein [Candidatus Neomarinimicrobiota bacterium]MCF7827525.1 hypothetical protein [Candidatus Neomarinimicrobiota bacterium]MCF7881613.1 hypothetical protein [Candidatus Neomarinimicrobiota bacterium]
MNTYISAHVIACLTRQGLQSIVKGFKNNSNDDVRHVRTVCDTISGKMVCEWEARDKEVLVEWLKERNIRLRGQEEWIMQGRLDTEDGELG